MPTKIEQAAIEVAAANRPKRLKTIEAMAELLEAKYPGAIDRAIARRKKTREDARFTGKVPSWARRYVLKHAYSSGVTLQWRISRSPYKVSPSGHCYGNHRLVVTAHVDDQDGPAPRNAVLHEIAHANAPSWAMHGPEFYDELLKLVKAEGLYRFATTRFQQGQGLRAAARRARG